MADSGEGRWTLQAAIEESVPAPVLSAALYERFNSRGEGDFADILERSDLIVELIGGIDPARDYVLQAMGWRLEAGLGSLRLSTGYATTDEEISRAVAILRSVLTRAPARA